MRGLADAVPREIDAARAVLRDEKAFFDPRRYRGATRTIDNALDLISAAYHPLELRFVSYRTPFALTSRAEIEHDAAPDCDPFDDYVNRLLIPRLERLRPEIIGLSVVFPGQIQPAFSFALKLKRAFPGVHLTAGGPAMAQRCSCVSTKTAGRGARAVRFRGSLRG